jgi:glycosyltransferase involved in cell wall biosynthesis
MVEISVVVPVYGCRDCLVDLHHQLTSTLKTMDSRYEIIFVDDRSPDGAWPVLDSIAADDPRVKAIRLSRNFGQHAAITAGLAASQGEWTVVMDCDLQDPPEAIARLYARAKEGFDLVLARRKERTHSAIRLALAKVYFRLLNTFMGTNIDGAYGTFSILNRKVVDAYLSVGDRERHYLFVLYWLGFEHGTIEVEHHERGAGGSSYTLGRLLRHAISGVFFQTTNLLIYIVYVGFVVAGVGVLGVLYLIYISLVGHPPAGYISVMVVLLLIGGFIITSTGVTGLYIGRVFQQVKGRPLYVVDTVTHQAESHRALREKPSRQEVESVH